MNRYFKSVLKLLVIAIIGGVIVYRVFFSPIRVETVKVGQGVITAEAMGTGTLQARVRATISPRISGRIAQMLADQGDKVTQGQLLATLDDKDLLQQVEIAKAELDLAQAGVERAAAEVNRAEAVDRNAKASFARYSRLTDTQAVSAKEVDQAKEDLEVAQAEVNQSRAARIETEKQITKAQASLRYYQERLADTKIVAPFDGLITRRSRDPGDIVVPGSSILDMVYLDPLWISAWVDETMLNQLKVGQIAKIVFRSDSTTELPGKVARISPQVDTETREVLVDVTVDRLPQSWAVGQRTEVYIETDGKENVTVIPQRVVIWHQQQPGVYVVENGRSYWREISLGIKGKDKVEVTGGLQPGQVVVVPGLKLPPEGRVVKVITE